MTRFGVPSTVIFDNAKCFIGAHICSWALKYGIYLRNFSNYYPQGNVLAKSSNKNLIKITRRTIEDNKRSWHAKFKTTLWADRITPKREIKNSPFMLVHGKEERIPISLELPSLELAHQLELEENDPMTTG